MKPKKILITGSSGYVGHFLAQHFSCLGIPVVGIDLQPHPYQKSLKNFDFFSVDVRSQSKLRNIIESAQPSHIFHLAYLMDPTHDLKMEYEVDVKGSLNMFDLAAATPSVKQLILLSSTSIYGARPDNREWITEKDPVHPGKYRYAVYKKKIEGHYLNSPKRKNLKIVIFRMCTAVGGSYYKKGGVVSSLHNGPFSLQVGPKTNALQFIHENDAKALFEKVAYDEQVEDIFNLCPDSFATSAEFASVEKKRLIKIPIWVLKIIFFLGWNLRFLNFYPAMADLIAYPIIATPKKIIKKYSYQFQFTSKEAYLQAVKDRKKNGTL